MKPCRHGVEWKSIHVWNDACARCRRDASLNESARQRAHYGAMYRTKPGTTNEPMTSDRVFKPGATGLGSRFEWEDDEVVSAEWRRRKRLGDDRRRAQVPELLAAPLPLPPLPDLTGRQLEVYWLKRKGLSLGETAEVLGLDKSTVYEHLDAAYLNGAPRVTEEPPQPPDSDDPVVWEAWLRKHPRLVPPRHR